jgi:lysophospholipase L1-like esterase
MTRRLALLPVLLVMAGCGGGDSSPNTPTRPDPVPSGPTIACPANLTATTTGTTAQVAYPAPTSSGGQPPLTVACTPASGSQFPLGSTNVTCTATDSLNRQATCSFAVSVTRLPTLQRTSFLAFGDSVTAGEVTVPTSSGTALDGFPSFQLIVVAAASYPTQLQAMLRTRYITQQTAIAVANAGVPGERATQGAQRFPSVMSQVRPEVVLLLEGYNDLSLLGAAGVNQAAAAIETMARDARTRGARVFIASLTPPRGGGRNTLPADVVTNFNTRMRSIATGEGAVFVDLYQALVGNITLYIGVDGLHPTEVGYQRIAETFFAAVQATLENR